MSQLDELQYPRIRQTIVDARWAIQPEKLATILDFVNLKAGGGHLTAEEIQAQVGAARRGSYQTAGSVAVLPLFGTIMPRANLMTEFSGGTSIQGFAKAFREALNDDSVGSILIEVDSPGGIVDGIPELADEIRSARGGKPIIAHANGLAASAAYWVASAADELIMTPSGEVGSIGVFIVHYDRSGMLEQAGVQPSLISAGRYKTEGNPFEPLGEDARAYLQEQVDEFYGMFVGAVAKGRGVGIKEVREGFGQGRVVTAATARRLGMVDRVETFDATVARLSGAKRPRQGSRAELVGTSATARLDGQERSASTERRRRGLWLMSEGRKDVTNHG
ncbi:MAG: S49 family peptidase [Pigmentiphaga sp.]